MSRHEGETPKISRRDFVRSAGIAGAAAVLLSASALHAPRLFAVTRHRHAVRGLRTPVSVAFLTDLHLGPFLDEDDLRRWIGSTRDLDPDLMVLGGDLVDSRYRGDLSELVSELGGLRPSLGVHAVLGNHDHSRYRRIEPLREALAAAGVQLLDNDAVVARDDLVLAGIDDLRVGRPDVDATLRAAADLGATGEEGDPALVFLSHNPDVIPDMPLRPDLLLAGHTHGGQVRLPFIGAIATSSRYGRRYLDGWVGAPFPAFVSRGLGVTGVPFRYDCPAELVHLLLEPG